MCRSLKEESCQAKTSKEEGMKEWGCEIENWWLLISWVQSLRYLHLLWVLCPEFPESFQWVSPFLEVSWTWAPLNFDSDFVLDPFQSLYTSQTETEKPIYFSTFMSETLFSLMRIGFAAYQIQFTTILGKSALSVSEQPYWFLSHNKHLHCLCQANPVTSSIINQEVLPQEDVTHDPGL